MGGEGGMEGGRLRCWIGLLVVVVVVVVGSHNLFYIHI